MSGVAGAFRSSLQLRFGVVVLAVLALFGVAAHFALPSPLHQDLMVEYQAPGLGAHPLGTDPLGRDVLSWIGASIFTSFAVGLGGALLSAAIGTAVGLCAGYAGGAVDAVLMRVADLTLSVPGLPLFIAVLVAVPHPGLLGLIVLLSAISWVAYARLVRSRVLVNRDRGFVSAARLAGRRTWQVLVLHLLPTVASEVLVLGSLQAGSLLLAESGLSFLGLGLQPPWTSLGFIISQGEQDLGNAWWIATFPGLCVAALVLGFNLVGDGLRDVLKVDVSLWSK